MATLVLTAAGTAVAGPIGGAIGAVIGQAADQVLFAPKARRGPRLGDLSVQTSSYGSQIPKLFGRIRVAGTVVWATDLVEARASSGGGKGRPRSIAYSYSANFAVALSARRVRAVNRIWADGKLLRGAAGDLKTGATIRFHDGDEDQPPDPLIVSAEGAAATPAFRGTAYMVFEDFQLEDYGNRIPSLTFEIEADPASIAVGAIAEELSGGAVSSGATPHVVGYAASGDSVRSALAALADPMSLSLAAGGSALLIDAPSGPAAELDAAEFAATLEITRAASGTLPADVSVNYYEATRDYQTGTQHASLRGVSRTSESLSLPAVLAAPDAKALAEAYLARRRARSTVAALNVAWRSEALRPGTLVRLSGQPQLWKVDRWLLASSGIELGLSRMAGTPVATTEAVPGRAAAAADRIHGPTTVRLLDLPLPISPDGPGLAVLAGGVEPGWRRAALLASTDGGATWNELGPTAEPATLGTSLNVLPPGSSALIDTRASVDIALLNESLVLESRPDEALAAGANLASLGKELIQFGSAEPLGDGRYRLSRLLRGRRGTEWAASTHGADEEFALLQSASMVPLAAPAAAIGATSIVVAAGVGDPVEGARAEAEISGEALRPPSPVHLDAVIESDGTLAVSWVRRSRLGWDWTSGGDAPLGEDREAYSVTVSGGSGSRSFELDAPGLRYGAAERAADGVALPATIGVVQVGTYATSRSAVLTIG